MVSSQDFSQRCWDLREEGFQFLAIQATEGVVTYLFTGHGRICSLQQTVESGAVVSITPYFPIADYAERQLYRDREIKALGNSNLVSPPPAEPDRPC